MEIAATIPAKAARTDVAVGILWRFRQSRDSKKGIKMKTLRVYEQYARDFSNRCQDELA